MGADDVVESSTGRSVHTRVPVTPRGDTDSVSERTSAPRACPTCGEAGVPIVYGLPGPELVEEADRGAIILGGCCVIVDAPMANVGCTACDTEWHDPTLTHV